MQKRLLSKISVCDRLHLWCRESVKDNALEIENVSSGSIATAAMRCRAASGRRFVSVPGHAAELMKGSELS
jgi:hypothetical protein